MTEQLILDVEGWPALQVTPTPAMAKGDQTVAQCSWCGTVVIQPRPATQPLGTCPCCRRADAPWWPQDLPLAGVSEEDR